MFSSKYGVVKKILNQVSGKTEILVIVKNEEKLAINFDYLTGFIEVNDEVILNTTAIDLNLGSGGYHFVIYNLRYKSIELINGGHIMKLRYTPYQIKVLAAEEQQSPYHHLFNEFTCLEKTPVFVATLHSMLTPIATTLKYLDDSIKISYVMTDGAALAICFSDMVAKLKRKKIIDQTITIGNAFGGDLETVNIYNGLIAAKTIAKSDAIIVSMGPGIVGTGTKYGFTGVEQGSIIDAVNTLGGTPIAIPRISFADARNRHFGISHHTITSLDKIAKTSAKVIIPKLEKSIEHIILKQVEENNLDKKHEFLQEDGMVLLKALKCYNISLESMCRKLDDDPTFFFTCSAAAVYCYNYLLQ